MLKGTLAAGGGADGAVGLSPEHAAVKPRTSKVPRPRARVEDTNFIVVFFLAVCLSIDM
jgi:hypothetical protein